MSSQSKVWHYGLVARCWVEFKQDGPEIPYFQEKIRRFGQPALDLGCGTGRLLLHYLHAGLQVDGCDISGDMLAYCTEKARAAGYSPRLFQQAMHKLTLPDKYNLN